MDYYNQIKEQIINNEITKKVKDYSKNRSDLNTYYKIGKLLVDAGKHYGEGIIKEYSKKLTNEFGKGYRESNLKYFRQYYYFSNRHTVCDNLTWSHYRTLLSVKDEEVEYYIKVAIDNNLSVRELKTRIDNNDYKRLSNETRNKFINQEKCKIEDLIKNPILIKNSYDYNEITEKVLKKLILEDIDNFLTELGNGFCFIKSEYKIKLGERYNYIDLLLFNYIYNCFVVLELKVTELKKEHIGQIQVYMNYIDINVRKVTQGKTIGIIIVKKDNKFIMDYCSEPQIFRTVFKIE